MATYLSLANLPGEDGCEAENNFYKTEKNATRCIEKAVKKIEEAKGEKCLERKMEGSVNSRLKKQKILSDNSRPLEEEMHELLENDWDRRIICPQVSKQNSIWKIIRHLGKGKYQMQFALHTTFWASTKLVFVLKSTCEF